MRWRLAHGASAQAALRAALALDPGHADAKYYLALQLMKQAGSVAEAVRLLGAAHTPSSAHTLVRSYAHPLVGLLLWCVVWYTSINSLTAACALRKARLLGGIDCGRGAARPIEDFSNRPGPTGAVKRPQRFLQ